MTGRTETMEIESLGKVFIIGDGQTSSERGLSDPRVILASAMQANKVVELFMEGRR